MSTNYYLHEGHSKIISAEIIESGHLAKGRRGCAEPYCIVSVSGHEKELIFGCDIAIENYKKVGMSISAGLWGFDVILSKRLLID